MRSLETNYTDDKSWVNHPLRKLALAEAYSMWSQAEMSSPIRQKNNHLWESLLNECIILNNSVATSSGKNSHELMRFSAINNCGNAYYYTGNYKHAKKYYESALSLNKNLSSAGNLIAIYVILGKLEMAINLSFDIRKWAYQNGKALTEPSQFSSILVNASYAFMIKGDFIQALDYLYEAYAMEPDDLNALNLALALILNGNMQDANTALQHFKYPSLNFTIHDKKSVINLNYTSLYPIKKFRYITVCTNGAKQHSYDGV